MRRLLLLGPIAEPGFVGGLQLALQDVQRLLESRGWQVDATLYADSPDAPPPSFGRPPASLGAMQQSARLVGLGQRVSGDIRQTAYDLLSPAAAWEDAARHLRWADARLRELGPDDVVLVSVDWNVRGLLALALARHPRVAVLSLSGLAWELRPTLWWPARLRRQHPFHYVPARAGDVRCAIFASDRWRDQAIAAGLPSSAAHTIYFGVPPGPPQHSRSAPGRRVLWVGRLAPEKGLHVLLEALPALRAQCPGVTVTAVAAQGHTSYRELIERQIAAQGARDVVTLRPAVPRDKLPELYATHDVLFFHSIYDEPVALVLLDAYRHGLPVAASHAVSPLIEEAVTCLTYDPRKPVSAAIAVQRLLDDPALGARLARSARERVERTCSLEAMGTAYDRVLRAL